MSGFWNAHSDRDYQPDPQDYDHEQELEDENRRLLEQIKDLKSAMQRMVSDLRAAEDWVRAYEAQHGPLQREPRKPDFMVIF